MLLHPNRLHTMPQYPDSTIFNFFACRLTEWHQSITTSTRKKPKRTVCEADADVMSKATTTRPVLC